MRRLFLTIALLTAVISLHGQSIRKTVKQARKAFDAGNYYASAAYYRQVMNADSSLVAVNYGYAESCRMIREFSKAEKWYAFVVKKDRGKKFPLAAFHYAQILKSLGK